MKPTTGFLTCSFTSAAASSSALPPISPIMTMASVPGSSLNSSSASVWLVPMIGSPPMPMQVRLADAERGELRDRLVGQRAAAAHDADRAAHVDVAGHDADLALLAGRDDARAVGADEARLAVLRHAAQTFTMSSVGMPSVMQTTSGDARRRPPPGSRRPRRRAARR